MARSRRRIPARPCGWCGGLAYPANSKLDWENDVWLPWFDYWLKGKPTDVLKRPAVLYYLMGDVDDPEASGNKWVAAEDFPPRSTATAYYAHSDHSLRTEPPAMEDASIGYVYAPRDPVPTVGRVHARLPVKGPYDSGSSPAVAYSR